MKRKLNRLSLHKETLRNLEDGAMRGVAGAARTDRCTTDPLQCPVGTSVDPSGCHPTQCFGSCDTTCA
jgi:hypothetical protein